MPKWIISVLVFLYGLGFCALLLDSYKNPDKFLDLAKFGPELLVLLTILINILIRIYSGFVLPSQMVKVCLYSIFPVCLLVCIGLSIWAFVSPSNVVYAKIPINSLEILEISMLALCISAINASTNFWRKNYRQIIFIVPFGVVLMGSVMAIWPNDFFVQINEEDSLVENSQFMILTISSIFAAVLSWKYWHKKNSKLLLSIAFVIFSGGLFGLAGEEISWGQRIFGIVTPDNIANSNLQQEINIHNLKPVVQYTNFGYIVIGLFGLFGWLLFQVKRVRNNELIASFIIPWYLSSYFLWLFLYNFWFRPDKSHDFGVWSETIELIFYIGVLGLLVKNYLKENLQSNR